MNDRMFKLLFNPVLSQKIFVYFTIDAADVVLPQSRESPPLMINIENNPVIDVNVHAQS